MAWDEHEVEYHDRMAIETDDDVVVAETTVRIATWVRVRRDVAQDVREFTQDFTSSATRTIVAFVAQTTLHVERSVALSTALLLGGASIFSKDTNWGRRSRKWVHIWLANKRRRRG